MKNSKNNRDKNDEFIFMVVMEMEMEMEIGIFLLSPFMGSEKVLKFFGFGNASWTFDEWIFKGYAWNTVD